MFSVDPDYEMSTLNKLMRLWSLLDKQQAEKSDQISQTESKIRKTLREITENCNFYSLRNLDEGVFREFIA